MAKIKETQIDEKYLWMGGGLIATIVVIFVLGKMSAKKNNNDPSDANPNINPITVNTASGTVDWNPSATVKKVHTAFVVNWFSGRAEAIEDLSKLLDVQLRAVADGYKQVYGSTLRKVLTSAWITGRYYDDVIRRLDVLQIP